jgi:putative tryptophan/tyrosine transport system substrate-binding protein
MNCAIASTAALLRFLYLAAILMLLWASLPGSAGAYEEKQAQQGRVHRIGFHVWKPGKIYDEAMAGIKDGLKIANIRYESVVVESNQNEDRAIKNLQMLDGMKLDLIYSLSSAATQIVKKIGMTTPVVATVINHPASLNISTTDFGKEVKLSGTSYYVDVTKQLELYRDLFPRARKIGMIYDSKNPAGYLAEQPFLRDACAKAGLDFLSVGVNTSSELAAAAKRLLGMGADMIVIPTNNLVYEHLATVLEVTNPREVPVVSMSKQGVENGALAALYADTYDLGRQAGELAARILKGEVDPSKAGFQFARRPDVIINLTSAKALNYRFPADVLDMAAIVIH